MVDEHLVLAGAKVAVLALGGAIALLAFLAWRRQRSTTMLWLAVAFGLIALGSFLEGLLFEALGFDLISVQTIESAFVLAGLMALAVVLRPRAGSATPEEVAP